MDVDQHLTASPTTIETYEAEEDFVDCIITCAEDVKIRAHRLLLRVIPWFRNVFKMQKALPVKIPLPSFSAHLVQKLVNFCSPSTTFSSENVMSWLPLKKDIPQFVAMLDFFMMRHPILDSVTFKRFRLEILEPIGRCITEDLLVARSANDAKSEDTTPNVLSPSSILYLFSQISFDGWPEDFTGAEGILAIASAGIPMRQILDTYPCIQWYFTDEFCSMYSGRKKEDLSDLIIAVPCTGSKKSDIAALVHRLLNVGVRPLILLGNEMNVNHPHKLHKVASFGWRLGWPLSPFVIAKHHAFHALLESIVGNTSLTTAEVRQVRELLCIIGDVEPRTTTNVPKPCEIAALLGYCLAPGVSSYLADPCLKKGDPAKTIHDLVEADGTLVKKVVLMKHLERHKFLDDHEVAAEYYGHV